MNPILRNILVFIAALIGGSIVNMALVSWNGPVIPLPEGADTSTMEALAESMVLFKPIHFLAPFLGHAVGTLVGAVLVALFAASHKMQLAMAVGGLFLLCGIWAVMTLPAPMWFNALDLIVSYIPMAWIGWKIGDLKKTD